MRKFEYKRVAVSSNQEERVMTSMGASGWQLCSVVRGTWGTILMYFMREIEEILPVKVKRKKKNEVSG
jgi:hypothetical protein